MKIPSDLLAAAIVALATLLFTLTPLSDLPVRIPLGLVMVLFVPGYTLIAALFPKKADLEGIERTALAFGLSIAVVPLIGLGLNYTPWGIRLEPVLFSGVSPAQPACRKTAQVDIGRDHNDRFSRLYHFNSGNYCS